MSRLNHLTLADIRSVFRLVHECCEFGADPIGWRRHMLSGVGNLIGALCGTIFLGEYPIKYLATTGTTVN